MPNRKKEKPNNCDVSSDMVFKHEIFSGKMSDLWKNGSKAPATLQIGIDDDGNFYEELIKEEYAE